MSRHALKIVLPAAVLVIAVAAAALLASSRGAPPRTEKPALGPLVEVLLAATADVPVEVTGHGEVTARTWVEVVPEVSGRVLEVHPELVPGGLVRAGEALLVVDPRDYELAVERARATVARATVRLEQELAEAAVARSEWEAIHPGQDPASGLTAREPQVAQARAELAAAEAELAAAALALDRTTITLPFDGVVVSESVDPGQVVAPGRAVAQVYGTATVEVRVPLDDGELAWFALPTGPGTAGAVAEVSARFAGARHTWPGRVVRMEGQVDPVSRLVHVVVEVPRPFARTEGRPALMPGTFVDVAIRGTVMKGVVPVPRHALHGGRELWVVEDGVLRVREVEVVRADRDTAYLSAGVSDGEAVVVSALDAVTDGMTVRVPSSPTAGEDAGETTA